MSTHAYCIYVLYPGQEIAILSWISTVWILFHSTGILMIIHHSSSLTMEVNKHNSCVLSIIPKSNFPFVHLQGKRTFRIAHDIMNRSNDSELMQSVKILLKEMLFILI